MIKTIFNAFGKKPYFLAVFSSLLTALPLIYPNLFFLSWFSMIPFLYALFKSDNRKKSFKITFCFASIFYLVSYSWFLYLHPLDWKGIDFIYSLLASILIWFAASMVHTVCLSFLGVIFTSLKAQGLFKIFVVAAIWIFIEAFYAVGTFAFPWVRLALTQYKILPSLQSTALFGSLFISFLIVIINGLFTMAIESKKSRRNTLILVGVSLYVINLCYGLIANNIKEKNTASYQTVKVAAIQGNLNPIEKWTEGSKDAFGICMSLSRKAAEDGAKIILWPETTLTSGIIEGGYIESTIQDFVDTHNVVLVIGTFIENDNGNHNSLVTFYKDYNGLNEAYHKRHRVPFGEYVPQNALFDWFFKAFSNLSMGQGIEKGQESIVYETPFGKITSLICFDSVFPTFSAEAINKGAELLLISTNDAYYRDSTNPYQHKAHAILRAMENNRYVLRSANTGISAIIDNNGNVLNQLEYNIEGYITADIKLINEKTLYTKTGDLILYFALGVIIASVLYSIKKSKK